MELSAIIHQHLATFKEKYSNRLLPSHLQAMHALLRCRTPQSGEIMLYCSDCHQTARYPRSCGHRSCPKCQHHETGVWLDRQARKLLPVEYFMLTFTLPYELRALLWRHQRLLYTQLFTVTARLLKDFGLNEKHLEADIGMTSVLHTHSRRLDYHPHLHVIVPGGGIDQAKKQWKKKKGKYLFNAFALAKVFRARFLTAIKEAGLNIPKNLPKKWVVDCRHVGRGMPALKYLSRYLYRGVISEKNIIAHQDGEVTFKYEDSQSGTTQTCTLKGEDFLWLIVQHVLPKGFRRIRDYGFLHGNAKRRLSLIQIILHVMINHPKPRSRPVFKCPQCQAPLHILGFIQPVWESG